MSGSKRPVPPSAADPLSCGRPAHPGQESRPSRPWAPTFGPDSVADTSLPCHSAGMMKRKWATGGKRSQRSKDAIGQSISARKLIGATALVLLLLGAIAVRYVAGIAQENWDLVWFIGWVIGVCVAFLMTFYDRENFPEKTWDFNPARGVQYFLIETDPLSASSWRRCNNWSRHRVEQAGGRHSRDVDTGGDRRNFY